MYDKELAIEILHQIEIATQKVIQRFQVINNPNDFADTEAGIEKMDAICMMLIVIGESLKNLDKISGQKLLKQYPNVPFVLSEAKYCCDLLR